MRPHRLLALFLVVAMVGSFSIAGAATAITSRDTILKDVDNSTTLPMPQMPGEVWADKTVQAVDGHNSLFTITLEALAEPLADGGSILNPDAPSVTITDQLGAQFEPVMPINPTLTYQAATNTISWVIDQSSLIAGAQISFQVRLRDGWIYDEWYETNDSASALFAPVTSNPHYYFSTVTYTNGFTADVNLNISTVARLRLTDSRLGLSINLTHFDSGFMHDSTMYTCWDYFASSPPALDGYYGFYRLDNYDFVFWITGINGPGTVTSYLLLLGNPGGNWINLTGDVTVSFSQPQPNMNFTWIGDSVIIALDNNGRIRIEEGDEPIEPPGPQPPGPEPEPQPIPPTGVPFSLAMMMVPLNLFAGGLIALAVRRRAHH